MNLDEFNNITKFNPISFNQNEKIIIREAAKSNCTIYGGFLRDKLLNKPYKDIDMVCDNLDFIHFLSKYNDVQILKNQATNFYPFQKNYAKFNDILINYGLYNQDKQINVDYSCNAIAYSTNNNNLFATNKHSLNKILNDLSNNSCERLLDFIPEYRKNLMKNKGFKIC